MEALSLTSLPTSRTLPPLTIKILADVLPGQAKAAAASAESRKNPAADGGDLTGGAGSHRGLDTELCRVISAPDSGEPTTWEINSW